MHTEIAPKGKPTGHGNPTAVHTDTLTVPNLVHTDKVLQSLRAAYVLHGHALHRTDPNDGVVTFWVKSWRMVRYLLTIHLARQFLDQIRGRL